VRAGALIGSCSEYCSADRSTTKLPGARERLWIVRPILQISSCNAATCVHGPLPRDMCNDNVGACSIKLLTQLSHLRLNAPHQC
jgi:hypothetical protein